MRLSFLRFLVWVALFQAGTGLSAQENTSSQGRFSGSLEAYGNLFITDKRIGASNTPQYDHQLFGSESWIALNYSNWGFDMGIRLDVFNNSNLINRTGSYNGQGIGRWYVKKKIENLEISGGYLYDQFGSGIVFRAFEDRSLAIDNALFGLGVSYQLTPDWKIRGYTGKQKFFFNTYNTSIKAAALDGFFTLGDSTLVTFAPGIGFVNKTFDDQTANTIVNTITTYTPVDSIGLCYNAYAVSLYNTMTAGNFTWYVEGALKGRDVMYDPLALKTQWTGTVSQGKLINKPGSVFYTSVSYSIKGLGISLEGKRTENFNFRTNPFVTLNQGFLNFIPPITRLNTYRLTARYNAATQEFGELGTQADIRYSFNKKWSAGVNVSNITNLSDSLLYREIYAEVNYKTRTMTLNAGIQMQRYNQAVYEGKPQAPMVETFTPFAEFLYRFSRKTAIRTEVQYLDTHQDFGSWIFGLVEFSIAPTWIFTTSNMYNIVPKKGDDIHYPTLGVVYSKGSNRISLNYIKQVEGVVCTGGVCRYEPAFNGVRMTINSTF